MFEDDLPQSKPEDAIIPGEDLSDLSIEALQARRDLLSAEIERIGKMIESKQSGRDAAEAFFKQG